MDSRRCLWSDLGQTQITSEQAEECTAASPIPPRGGPFKCSASAGWNPQFQSLSSCLPRPLKERSDVIAHPLSNRFVIVSPQRRSEISSTTNTGRTARAARLGFALRRGSVTGLAGLAGLAWLDWLDWLCPQVHAPKYPSPAVASPPSSLPPSSKIRRLPSPGHNQNTRFSPSPPSPSLSSSSSFPLFPSPPLSRPAGRLPCR
jgi:hypothetical protein